HARNFADALRWVLAETVPAAFPDADRPNRWHVAGDEADVLEVARLIAEAAGKRLRYRWDDYHSSRPGHDHPCAPAASQIHGGAVEAGGAVHRVPGAHGPVVAVPP